MKPIKLITYLVLIFNVYIYSQSNSLFNPISANLPHVSNTSGESGFALNYSLPGFFSHVGQFNLYYSNSSSDSYFFGFGLLYIMSGVNKRVHEFENASCLYINTNIGITNIDGGSIEGWIGSIGGSYLFKPRTHYKLELAFDLYFNHGHGGGGFIPKIPYLWGFTLNSNYTYTFLRDFQITIHGGISLFQYRLSKSSGYIQYLTWFDEKKSKNSSLNPEWGKFNFQIPVGINITYSF